MRHWLYLSGIVLSLQVLPARAANEAAPLPPFEAIQDSTRCPGTDPFDLRSVVPAGPLKGQGFSSCVARSARALTVEEMKTLSVRPKRGQIAVANVTHAGHLYVAFIDPSAVEDVIVHMEHFPAPVPAAHAELRFRFRANAPAKLIPQRREDRHLQILELNDLVFSVEAITSIKEPTFDVSRSLEERYGIVYRLVSLEDKYNFMVVRQGHKVEQFRMKLTPEQKNKMLQVAISMATKASDKLMYHLLNRSCVTEMFRVIDQTIHYDNVRLLVKNFFDFTRHLPTLIPQALGNRDLMLPGTESFLPSLKDEMEARPAAPRPDEPQILGFDELDNTNA